MYKHPFTSHLYHCIILFSSFLKELTVTQIKEVQKLIEAANERAQVDMKSCEEERLKNLIMIGNLVDDTVPVSNDEVGSVFDYLDPEWVTLLILFKLFLEIERNSFNKCNNFGKGSSKPTGDAQVILVQIRKTHGAATPALGPSPIIFLTCTKKTCASPLGLEEPSLKLLSS